MGGAMLSKSPIQFSVDGWGCVPSLLFTWGQTMVEAMKTMATSFKRSDERIATPSAPNPAACHCRPTALPETSGHSGASLGQSLVGSLFLSPGSWCIQCFACALQESVSAVLCKFYNRISLSSKVRLPGGSQFHCQIPRLGNLLLFLELS